MYQLQWDGRLLLQAGLFLLLLLLLIGATYYLMAKWRGGAETTQPAASELLTKFRELHARGSLSDEEFRTIKTKLAAELEQGLNETKEPG